MHGNSGRKVCCVGMITACIKARGHTAEKGSSCSCDLRQIACSDYAVLH